MKMTFKNPGNPVTSRDVSFISVLYCTPVGRLIEMDRDYLRETAAKARLICRWLEGIADLVQELDQKGRK